MKKKLLSLIFIKMLKFVLSHVLLEYSERSEVVTTTDARSVATAAESQRAAAHLPASGGLPASS